jgi:hypothetical protein
LALRLPLLRLPTLPGHTHRQALHTALPLPLTLPLSGWLTRLSRLSWWPTQLRLLLPVRIQHGCRLPFTRGPLLLLRHHHAELLGRRWRAGRRKALVAECLLHLLELLLHGGVGRLVGAKVGILVHVALIWVGLGVRIAHAGHVAHHAHHTLHPLHSLHPLHPLHALSSLTLHARHALHMRHPSHPALRLRLPLPLPLTLLPGGLLCRYHLRKLRIILQHLHHARSACSTSTATSALPLPLLLLLLLLLHERRELLIIQRMRELRAGEGRSRRAIMLLLRLVGWLGHEH